MSQIRECSRKPRPVDEEGGRYISFSPPVEPASASQHKKNQRKKREKNSWKNGGFGAVNPKCQGRFLKVTQLSGRLGRGRKIEEIPFFRDRVSSNPAEGNKRSFKLSPAAATKIFGSSMIPQSPNKIVKASERARSVLVEVKKNGPLAFAPLSLIQYSIPQQASANCLAPQQRPRTVIQVAEPIFTPAVVSPPVRSIPETPLLIEAVIHRDYQLLERLLRNPEINVNAQDADGLTGLHYAILQFDLKTMKQFLMNPGINPNIQDARGDTPLGIAVKSYNIEAAGQLLAHPKIDSSIPNHQGITPIQEILKHGNTEFRRLLLSSTGIPLDILDNVSLDEERKSAVFGLEIPSCLSVEQAMSSMHDSGEYFLSPTGQFTRFNHIYTSSSKTSTVVGYN